MTANAVEIGVPALFTRDAEHGAIAHDHQEHVVRRVVRRVVPRIVPPGVSAGTEPVARDN